MDLLCVDKCFRFLLVVVIQYMLGIVLVFVCLLIPCVTLVLYNISLPSVYYSYMRNQASFIKVYVEYLLVYIQKRVSEWFIFGI